MYSPMGVLDDSVYLLEKKTLPLSPKSLVAALAIGEWQESVSKPSPGPLRVLRVYQNLMHNKWVIMVNVCNEGER